MQMEVEKFNDYNDRGLTGLCNLGNTCFMNSFLQCLSHSYEFNDFLKETTFWQERLNDIPEGLILWEWDKLRTLMWSENCIVEPKGFLQAVHKVSMIKGQMLFTGYAQNDITEFLQFIIECFHKAIHRSVDMKINGNIENNTDKTAKKCYEMMKTMYSKEYSEMLDIFYGIHVSKIEKGGELMSIKPEPYFIIDIPIQMKTGLTIYNCFEKYCSGEKLEGGNGWFNEKTNKKEDVVQTIVFWSLPEILVLDLKRFTPDGRKIQIPLNIETDELDLSKFVEGYGKEQYKYEFESRLCCWGNCSH